MLDVLVVGGGYSGLWGAVNAIDVARECNRSLSVTLVSRQEFLDHRPRLYEKGPDALRVPLRPLLNPLGIAFVRGEATAVDVVSRTVGVTTTGGHRRLAYRRLLLATGSELRRLAIPGLAEHAWNIDSYAGAKAFDDHLRALAADMRAGETFVVVGAGMTGIELATEMRERIAEHAGPRAAAGARVILVERADTVGPAFGDSPRPVIEGALAFAGSTLPPRAPPRSSWPRCASTRAVAETRSPRWAAAKKGLYQWKEPRSTRPSCSGTRRSSAL